MRSRVALLAVCAVVVGAGTSVLMRPAEAASAGCRASYLVGGQWQGGFTASVTVTNLGDPLTSWTITWDFPDTGQKISSGWSATWTQAGTRVTAASLSWNAALPTNGTVSVGFNGAGAGTPGPSVIYLNGVACTGSVATSAPPASPTRTAGPSPSPSLSPTPTRTAPASPTGAPTSAPASTATGWEDVITPSSFGSYAALEAEWKYLYPWGSDHNGSARMYGSTTDHNHVSLSGGTLTLKASRINWDEGTSTSDPHLAIRYHSGAIHAKDQVVVTDQFPSWEVKGEFQAPSARGTWPAFWLTGVNSWPPESDILEFKGDTRNWFNTFRTSSDVSSTTVNVSSPGNWHTYRAWITKVNATDVDIHYYLDGNWVGQHRASGFVGKPMWIIINLQMEGSSGSPGPSGDTNYRARNIYVGRNRVR